MTHRHSEPIRRADALICFGVFLASFCMMALLSPGRIDIIDGQLRNEAARGLLDTGMPIIRDRLLFPLTVQGNGGLYSIYSIGSIAAGLPMVWLSTAFNDPTFEMGRFLFTFTGPLFGALSTTILFLLLRIRGHNVRQSILWSVLACMASYLLPLFTSSFEQPIHLPLIGLTLLCSLRARSDRRWMLAAGLSAGLLLTCQQSYVLVTPWLCMLGWHGWNLRGNWHATCRFALGASVGVGIVIASNVARFSALIEVPMHASHPPIFAASPIPGLLSLLFSPGKSIVLYSPIVLLSLPGLWAGLRARSQTAIAISGLCATHLIFVSWLTFFGSDWAWGPRYSAPLLFTLSIFLPESTRLVSRYARQSIIGLSIVIQCLGASVDHQRFFLERDLSPYFWYEEPWYYFEHSALFTRLSEVSGMMTGGVPETAKRFNMSPYDSRTYCIFRAKRSSAIMNQFEVFYLPRPWPLWMTMTKDTVPISPLPWILGLLLGLFAGGALVRRGIVYFDQKSADVAINAEQFGQ
ncbi:MAG: hypothetical protein VX223_05450 [Myxococcota bacterium]|nr:hypothetical protein [Myxococcota bacterium]